MGLRLLYAYEPRLEAYQLQLKIQRIENRIQYTSEPVEEMHSFMDSIGIRFPKIVLCQGILETGWFQNSKVLEENNNWLGLKCAQYRKTYCKGTNLGHAVFDSRAHCLLDYLEWQKKYIPRYEEKYGPMKTDEDYYNFLLKWDYAEDKAYINKLKKIKKLIYE